MKNKMSWKNNNECVQLSAKKSFVHICTYKVHLAVVLCWIYAF